MITEPLYYFDETWVSLGHVQVNIWVGEDIRDAKNTFMKVLTSGPKNSPSKGKWLIVTYIGSEKKFVEDSFWVFELKSIHDNHEELNSDNFFAMV